MPRTRRPRARRERGFTLIELMVVVAVISILAALMTPFLTEYLTKNRLLRVANQTRHVIQWAHSEAGNLDYCIAVQVQRGDTAAGGFARAWAPVMDPAVLNVANRSCSRWNTWAQVPAKRRLLAEFDLSTIRSGSYAAVQMQGLYVNQDLTTNLNEVYLLFDQSGVMQIAGPCGAVPRISQVMIQLHSLKSDGKPMWDTVPMDDPRRKQWIRELYVQPTGATRLTIYDGQV